MSRNLRTAFLTLSAREIHTLLIVYKLEKKTDFSGNFSVRTLYDETHAKPNDLKRDLKLLTEKGYLVIEHVEPKLSKTENQLYGQVRFDHRITKLGRLYVEEICANVFGYKGT